MIIQKTSEWVSIGHPDKMADYISSYILDRYLEKDRKTRYALEVQIKDNFVSLAGEITSEATFDEKDLLRFVREAIHRIGYTASYADKWGRTNVTDLTNLDIATHISQQSPDIRQGVDGGGWGDQGIFWGMAVNDMQHGFMPLDFWYAKMLGSGLYRRRLGGIDIKMQVTIDWDVFTPRIREIVVAVPVLDDKMHADVKRFIDQYAEPETTVVLNGTGRYVRHGSVGDCGTTGRKLAVDFYGGNCRVGGGSPWTKDGTKADLALNLLARFLSVAYISDHPGIQEVYTSISCKIGQENIRVQMFRDNMVPICDPVRIPFTPAEAIRMFRLQSSSYADRCMQGLFTIMPMFVSNNAFAALLAH